LEITAYIPFLLCAALILYVVFGYPLLMNLMGRRRDRAVMKRPYFPKVSVVLPVRDGAEWIEAKLHSLLGLIYPRDLIEILVVSDGSVDGTDEIVRQYAIDGVQLIRIARSGKASALNAGMARARGEILFFTDVRQTLDRNCLERLTRCFADESVGVVSGELVLQEAQDQGQGKVGLYWRYEKWIRARQSALDSVLGATGCIYAIRKSLVLPLPADTLLDDVYLPLAAFFRGYRVILENSARAYDTPAALPTEFLRKVRTLAGVYQIVRTYPQLLTFRNRMWVHFMSHKLGRLMLPHAMIVMAVSAFALPEAWRILAVGGQGLFYACALADRWVPESWRAKSATSSARAFVVLVTAAFCAVPAFLFGNLDVWTPARMRPATRNPQTQLQ